MKALRSIGIVLVLAAVAAVFALAWSRMTRVAVGRSTIPVYPGAREAAARIRYWPRILSWDDRSSARVQVFFGIEQPTALIAIARHAHAILEPQGWYLVTPDNLDRFTGLDLVVWQREPDERLDLMQAWPIPGLSREQRLYGGIFPPTLFDSALAIEWSWSLGGPRSSPPRPPRPILRAVPSPEPIDKNRSAIPP